jgi:glyoxylase-like metal-dependent hydrolase (beta-lactamase superfamily II)/rhodanese-related sulfurtransferase
VLVKHFFTPKIAHSSYILAGGSTCAVVDPSRDTQAYMLAAEELGLRITHVLKTHLHADFVSGHLDLAALAGAEIIAPGAAGCVFPHHGVSGGDSFHLGSVRVDVLETPGHTPDHVSYVVTDTARGASPVGVFPGDTLFVGDVGRPDLFPGMAVSLASRLYESLRKLSELPDFCEVYPAHGAGSLCGRSMASKYTSTIGYETRFNPSLLLRDEGSFIESLTTGMPPAPDHFARCSEINRLGPALLSTLAPPVPLEPAAFLRAVSDGNCFVLDVRRYDSFAAQHVPGAWSVDSTGNLPTFAGWVAPPDRDILLVASNPEEAREAALWLNRVGLDRVTGYLAGGMFSWTVNGLPTGRMGLASVHEAHTAISAGHRTVLDVRAPSEYAEFHLPGSLNIPAPDLRTRYGELDPRGVYLVICSTGQRSALAASILISKGFSGVSCVAGGMRGFQAASLAPACPMCSLPHGPREQRSDQR